MKPGSNKHTLLLTGEKVLEGALASSTPGAFLVDMIPLCKFYEIQQHAFSEFDANTILVRHWPTWLMGGEFKKKAMIWRTAVINFVQLPFDSALKSAVSALISCYGASM